MKRKKFNAELNDIKTKVEKKLNKEFELPPIKTIEELSYIYAALSHYPRYLYLLDKNKKGNNHNKYRDKLKNQVIADDKCPYQTREEKAKYIASAFKNHSKRLEIEKNLIISTTSTQTQMLNAVLQDIVELFKIKEMSKHNISTLKVFLKSTMRLIANNWDEELFGNEEKIDLTEELNTLKKFIYPN